MKERELEIVAIELTPADRLRLDQQINDRMEKLEFDRYAYDKLDLGFELPVNWPGDMNSELNLGQLVVLACKLKMRILITGLELIGRKEAKADGGCSG